MQLENTVDCDYNGIYFDKPTFLSFLPRFYINQTDSHAWIHFPFEINLIEEDFFLLDIFCHVKYMSLLLR